MSDEQPRTPADVPDFEPYDLMRSRPECWFCRQPAVTIGYGFAVCAGRPDGEINCSERARDLFRQTVQEVAS